MKRSPLVTVLLALALAVGASVPPPAGATIRTIPVGGRVSIPRTETGNGLFVRYKDVPDNAGCSLEFCALSTDTVTQQTTTMANINYLLNQGTIFGPFNFGGAYFETRWDGWINIKAAGDYRFAIQVDDGAMVTIADSLIAKLDGGNWFQNVTSDTIRFEAPGLYPLRAYFFDCPVCCRGFRFGGMGPAGSGMMAWTPGFDFNVDLGPCCTFGGNGPGNSVVPAALFFRTLPTTDVVPAPGVAEPRVIRTAWASPNPARGPLVIALDLARPARVWGDVFDASGRRVATLANGATLPAGTSRWPWSSAWSRGVAGASGTWFYRFRTDDGESASGSVTVIR